MCRYLVPHDIWSKARGAIMPCNVFMRASCECIGRDCVVYFVVNTMDQCNIVDYHLWLAAEVQHRPQPFLFPLTNLKHQSIVLAPLSLTLLIVSKSSIITCIFWYIEWTWREGINSRRERICAMWESELRLGAQTCRAGTRLT